jgi:bifunctional non-homologous end joining protein LigD
MKGLLGVIDVAGGEFEVSTATWSLDGRSLRLTDLDKVYWPHDGLTKGDVLEYYRELAPVLLPQFKDRPVTTRVFPDGIDGKSFYRRDVPAKRPRWLRSESYRPASGTGTTHLIMIDDIAGLIWFANHGAIEFHTWMSCLPNLTEPDFAVFDLDPGEQVSFKEILRAARFLRDLLTKIGLTAYPKTSGRQGLHVLVPLAPGHSFECVRTWVKSTAEQLAAEHENLIAVAHGGTHRGHHVTIDYAQNSITRNLAAPYTLRAAPGAPVSAPLSWQEIEQAKMTPAQITINTMPARLQQKSDLFASIMEDRQKLPAE